MLLNIVEFCLERQYLVFITLVCLVTDGQNDSPVTDGDVSASPVPLQRTKPVSSAPLVPREPPPRQALLPRTASRRDRQPDSDLGKTDNTRQKPDSSSSSSTAANGESGVYVSRVSSFQSRKPLPKVTAAHREGKTNTH